MDIKDIKGAKITHAGLLQHNPDGTTETQKITHAGLVARSPEGTAAKGMNIRGNEDLWVEIQANTFRNWVNEHLRGTGMQVHDWSTDFCDGTHLCALVESLQTRPLMPAWNRRPANQHHYLENVTTALKAVEKDHIKLVNIGNVDIVNGNVKLILGLIWSLIVRYQIGRSKFPPRKLMLAWLQAALPECRITNLTTDWNSGVNLSALLDYCQPGLFPHWRSLDPSQSVRNCTNAMDIAQKEFGIPKVLEPEYLASPWLDELSGMTYLSYFMKPGGPGYNATLRWVNSQVKEHVTNFTTDWNDGRIFCEIIRNLGGSAPAPEKLSTDPFHYENNIRKVVEAGEKLCVKPVLSPKDMANPDVEHLGIMAYATQLRWVPPRPPLSDLLAVHLGSTSGRVGEPTHFRVDVLSRGIDINSIKTYIVPSSGIPHPIRLNKHGEGVFVPEKYGMHEITIEIGEDSLGGHFFRVLPRFIQVVPPGMAPCALGSLVEVLVNATGAPKTEDILVNAVSPSGRSHKCPLKKIEEGHSAIFKPDEAGIWKIAITYQKHHIQGGPFTCAVFDPNGISVHSLDGAMPLRAHSFEIDARGVGVSGELHVDIVHDKRSLVCSVEKIVENKYRITFMPRQNGKYRVYVYFNGYDVKGSPFIMRVGTKGKSGKTRSSPMHDNKQRSESPSMHYTTTTTSRHNDYLNVKKDLYNQNIAKQRSYSPQYSPRNEEVYKTSYYNSKKETKGYSPKVASLTRDIHPPKPIVKTDLYSTLKRESKKHIEMKNDYYYDKENELFTRKKDCDRELTLSPARDDESSYVTKTFGGDTSYTTKTRNAYSPVHIRCSPITRNSPTTSYYESEDRNMTSSPRNFTSSPIQEHYSASPNNYITTATHKMTGSPVTVTTTTGTGGFENLRRVEKTSTYKPTSNYLSDSNLRSSPLSPVNSRRTVTPEPIIDHSSNVKVSSKPTAGRRDSWDVINKTKHLLSPTSLESLANLTESQLNTDLSYNRPEVDNETERNTRYNKFLLSDSSKYHSERRGSNDSDKLKSSGITVEHTDSSSYETGENYSRIIKETTERHIMEKTGDYSYSSKFRPIDSNATGAQAICVQDISNGVLGHAVEFEIDGSRAGSGNLEILVNGGRVTSSVRSLGGQKFIASFTPHETGVHKVQITFNGETVPGKLEAIQLSVMSKIL